MSDKVCSDMGIFNGSFVDHSWICLLDRASGYVDKSFQKDSAHNRFMKGLQGVPAPCNYRYIALPRRFIDRNLKPKKIKKTPKKRMFIQHCLRAMSAPPSIKWILSIDTVYH
ncbi:hypothetical protein ACWOHR_004840 [Escherichia coli]